MPTSLKIRFRTLRGYLREAQGYAAWDEYQVVDGRRVIGRYDFLGQALRAHPTAVPDASAAPTPPPARKVRR